MKNVIQSTTNYELFKLADFKTSESHLKKIKESIDFNNCSCDYPILVDDNNQILEGRYRFIACKEMGLPIHYKVSEVTSVMDAIRIKHIYRHTDEESICKLYSDIKQYNDILLLMDEYKIFPCGFIIRASGACAYMGWGISRKKFISGDMDEFDIPWVNVILNLIKWLHYDFNLCIISSLRIVENFVDSDDSLDNTSENEIKNKILKYRIVLNKIELISNLYEGDSNRGYGDTKVSKTFKNVLMLLGDLEDGEICHYNAKIGMKVFHILGIKVKKLDIYKPEGIYGVDDAFDSNYL